MRAVRNHAQGVLQSRAGATLFAAALLLLASNAAAQELQLSVEDNEIYAELPFTLSVVASGFDESPEPTLSPLSIEGAQIVALGVRPSIQSRTTIINGRRSDSRTVTFFYQFRVTVPKADSYRIASLSALQGSKSASTQEAQFNAQEITASNDMLLQLSIPERAVWLGEAFELSIDWYLSQNVSNQTFVVPLFDMTAWFELEAPTLQRGQRSIDFNAGAKTISLPFEREQVQLQGNTYTRFRFTARARPLQAGSIAIPPAKVIAALEVGVGRDRFGFPSSRTRLYKAEDGMRTLEVRALPQLHRPASFRNAIGSGYAIEVKADRTVVRAGDPVALRIAVRGDGPLEGLILPPLDADGGLSATLFSFPSDPPAGEIQEEDGRPVKVFDVMLRVKSERAKEIPPLAFSFFDPTLGVYQTVRSQPIALSVAGAASVVGAQDVVSATETPRESAAGKGEQGASARRPGGLSLIGVDLGLSEPSKSLVQPLQLSDLLAPIGVLYVAPLAFFGLLFYRRRTESSRNLESGRKGVQSTLLSAIREARSEPASKMVAVLGSALSDWRRHYGSNAALQQALQQLETLGYDPQCGPRPLPSSLLDALEALAREAKDKSPSAGRGVALLTMLGVAGLTALTAPAHAQEPLDQARSVYQEALMQADRAQRTASFARAATLFAQLVDAHPNSPELLVDWGNAALGAQDLGAAVLAYRRALLLDPHNARATKNLAFARETLPSEMPRPREASGAMDALFFLNHFVAPPWRALAGAAFFAVGLLLLAPWRRERWRRAFRFVAIGPALMWLWLSASLLSEADQSQAAVIATDGVILRSADSVGAAAALSIPLSAGVEVELQEQREGWTRLLLADGTQGWVQSSAVAVVRR